MLGVIEEGLPLLRLQESRQERFVTRRSGRTPAPPSRDRTAHAAAIMDQIDQVERRLEGLRRDAGVDEPTQALVAASGPHVDEPSVAKSLAPTGSGLELVSTGD